VCDVRLCGIHVSVTTMCNVSAFCDVFQLIDLDLNVSVVLSAV